MTSDDHRGWTDTFAEELAELRKRRPDDPSLERHLVGLAFSGGGIRSATFGLGVLESLRRFGVLEKIDYLSTVSGGGYIGAWLTANCHRHADWLKPGAVWTSSIAHLRRYSNYLSPTVGFFSADTWSMATIWVRNTILVQITVILAIACALMLPRPLFELFVHWPLVGTWRWASIILFVLGAVGIAGNQMRVASHPLAEILKARYWPAGLACGVICFGLAFAYATALGFSPFSGGPVSYAAAGPVALLIVVGGFALLPVGVRAIGWAYDDADRPEQVNYTQGWVQGAVVVPLMAAGYLVSAVLWGESIGLVSRELASIDSFERFFLEAWRYWPFPLSVVFVSMLVLSVCAVRTWTARTLAISVVAAATAVLVLHALLSVVMVLLHQWAALEDGARRAFVWGPPLVAGAFVLSIVMLIGVMGRDSTEGIREWWSRLGAWLGIYATGWMVIAVSAVYGPGWLQAAAASHPVTALGASGGWLGTVLGGLLAGNSGGTGSGGSKSAANKAKEVLAAVAPFVFIAGLLVGVAWALDAVVRDNAVHDWVSVGADSGAHASHASFLTTSLAVLAGCTLALIFMASRVGINEFSLNAFYRNRLVRCYLGATRVAPGERTPQNFTGFDDNDDVLLEALVRPHRASVGPLHLVNCALNLGGSSDLALHTRHSAAFFLSPLHCGSGYVSRTQSGIGRELGFVRTASYGGHDGSPTLGQAISVSGAAASPNMGYHTSPVVAFLLTVFNVRLGWWFPNPNPEKASTGYPSPRFSLRYLFAELFGDAHDKSKFVMISDGGHFENLAAYELIRRKCRLVIISDGECDASLAFEGLGTLIRMCEVDFGHRISIDVGAIRDRSSGWSRERYAVGRIEYGDGSPDGTLIYLKASMTGHEDTSVLQYKASHPLFPHESTGDQFYGEDQFESYRRLGRDIARQAFETSVGEPDLLQFAGRLVARHREPLALT